MNQSYLELFMKKIKKFFAHGHDNIDIENENYNETNLPGVNK